MNHFITPGFLPHPLSVGGAFPPERRYMKAILLVLLLALPAFSMGQRQSVVQTDTTWRKWAGDKPQPNTRDTVYWDTLGNSSGKPQPKADFVWYEDSLLNEEIVHQVKIHERRESLKYLDVPNPIILFPEQTHKCPRPFPPVLGILIPLSWLLCFALGTMISRSRRY